MCWATLYPTTVHALVQKPVILRAHPLVKVPRSSIAALCTENRYDLAMLYLMFDFRRLSPAPSRNLGIWIAHIAVYFGGPPPINSDFRVIYSSRASRADILCAPKWTISSVFRQLYTHTNVNNFHDVKTMLTACVLDLNRLKPASVQVRLQNVINYGTAFANL